MSNKSNIITNVKGWGCWEIHNVLSSQNTLNLSLLLNTIIPTLIFSVFLACPYFSSFDSRCPSLPPTRCLSGAGLYDLSWWMGQRRGPADVRRADWQVQPRRVLRSLGLYLGYHGHPGRPHPLLLGFRPGEPAGRPHDRGAAGWKQGWE